MRGRLRHAWPGRDDVQRRMREHAQRPAELRRVRYRVPGGIRLPAVSVRLRDRARLVQWRLCRSIE
jgi:hypothetical protein